MNTTLPDPSLVVLLGVSGSGKSTFARQHFAPTEIVSSDHCRALVCDDETNQSINKDAFEILSKGKIFTIQFGGEKFKRIHSNYNQTDQGECFLIFNSLDLLEIGIYKGNANELLGLSYDSSVNIMFEE